MGIWILENESKIELRCQTNPTKPHGYKRIWVCLIFLKRKKKKENKESISKSKVHSIFGAVSVLRCIKLTQISLIIFTLRELGVFLEVFFPGRERSNENFKLELKSTPWVEKKQNYIMYTYGEGDSSDRN